MARSHLKHGRVYVDGYDWSGQTRGVGPLKWEFEVSPDAALTDEVKNVLPGQPAVGIGTLNTFLEGGDTGVTGLGAGGNGTGRIITVAMGAGAAPAAGDPCFCGTFPQSNYLVERGDSFVLASLTLDDLLSNAAEMAVARPWGYLLHARGQETAVNMAVGIDDFGAATSLGGFFVYHLLNSNGTVTLKAQDAATNSNGNFTDLSGATSGAIDASTTPKAGIVTLGSTATVRRYLRWQLAFGTATQATFVTAFVRRTY